jgi:hypothetical protein
MVQLFLQLLALADALPKHRRRAAEARERGYFAVEIVPVQSRIKVSELQSAGE